MPQSRTIFVLIIAAALLGATRGEAQAVTGLGEDATTAPPRSLRLTLGAQWSYADEGFLNLPGAQSGQLRALGAPFTMDSVGIASFPALKPLQDSVRALAGSAVNLSLGKTIAQVSDRIISVPITVEAGISRWLSIGVTVPIVHTRSNVFFESNPKGTEGSVGINPAISGASPDAFAADTSFALQITRAAAAVQSYCSGAGSGSAQCAGASSLVSSATSFGNTLTDVYTKSALVPTTGSAAQAAINQRAQSIVTSLNAFAGVSGSGVQTITATGVTGAATSLATPDFQAVLTDPTFGPGLDTLQTVERSHLGDIELNAKITIFDTFALRGEDPLTPTGFNLRASVGAGYRFPTGSLSSPDNLTDIDIGTHVGAVLLSGYTDVLMGSHFFTSVVAHFAKATTDSYTARFADTTAFPLASTKTTVSRQSGNLMDLQITPRWAFNDFFALGGQYVYRHKGADTYTYVQSPTTQGSVAGPDIAFAEATSDFTEQRFGGGLVISNASAVKRKQSRIPFDVAFMHLETLAGRGVPKYTTDQIMIRLYYGHSRY